MFTMLRRLFGAVLAGAVFIGAALILLQVTPASVGGGVLLAVLWLFAAFFAILVYRWFMTFRGRTIGEDDPGAEGGLAPGLGLGEAQSRRRRRDEDDADDYDPTGL